MKKRILVTGAGGFIGSHMAKYLVEKGYWVRVVDIKWDNFIEGKYYDEKLTLDLRNPKSCFESCEGMDEVYNLAANMGGIGYITSVHAEVASDNVLINVNMLEAIRLLKIKRVFYSSSACFVKGTKVFTDRNYVPIEKIEVGDKVIAEDGEYHKVKKITNRKYKGDLCKIKALTANDIICTPDHRFLNKDNNWIKAKDLKGEYLYSIKPDLSGGKDYIELEKNKYIEMYKELKTYNKPLYKLAEKYNTSLNTPYCWKRNQNFPNRIDPLIKNKINKDYDFGKFIGLVLSEGWYETNKNANTERLVVCFGKHEKKLIKEYKDLLHNIFSVPYSRIVQYNSRTAIKIHVTSKRLVKLVGLICNIKEGAYNKSLTPLGCTGSKEYRKGLLEGGNLGDGCKEIVSHGNFERYIWSTSSEKLALQYSLILKSLGICNSIQIRDSKRWDIEGRVGDAHILYNVYTKAKETRISNVSIIKNCDTEVYNLEVEDVHSYLVEGNVVHNCVYPNFKQLEAKVVPLKEEDAIPADPNEIYGWEKLFSEQLYAAYKEDCGTEVRIARFHNIFGEEGTYKDGREKAPAAMCRKIAQAKWNGEDLIIMWGDGGQTRSFLHVRDCVEGIYTLMQSNYDKPLNIGSDRLVTINELASMIMEIAEVDLKVEHDLTKPQGVRGRNSNNDLCKDVIGWSYKMSLKAGLVTTYKWIEEKVIEDLGLPNISITVNGSSLADAHVAQDHLGLTKGEDK